jgi:hypothetical protein
MAQNNPNRLTSLHILIYLRQRLLVAIEQNDIDELQDLAKVFSMLWDLVEKHNFQGDIGGVIENFENAALDYARGIGWKAIMPSEEEIRSALQSEEAE